MMDAALDVAVTELSDIYLNYSNLTFRQISPVSKRPPLGSVPLVSVRNAEFMKNELRVSVPDSIVERMARAATPEAARQEGVAIAREMLIAVRELVQGAQISAPNGKYSSAVDVLEALGVGSRPMA